MASQGNSSDAAYTKEKFQSASFKWKGESSQL
jgi:hypothetical protein